MWPERTSGLSKIARCTAFIFFAFISAPSSVLGDEAIEPGPAVVGGVINIEPEDGKLVWRDGEWLFVHTFPGAESVRVRIEAISKTGPGSIRIKDASELVVENLEILQNAGDTVWTAPVRGSRVSVSVSTAHKDVAPIKISGAIAYTPSFDPETIIGKDQLTDVVAYRGGLRDVVQRSSSAVGKLTYISHGVGYECSAFLVSEDTALTNDHCVNDESACKTAVLTMGYERGIANEILLGEGFRCLEVISHDYSLDFSLIRVANKPGQRFGFLHLRRDAQVETVDALVIQHPEGLPKKISASDCRLSATMVLGRRVVSDFLHSCDTRRGSSGSPIIDASGEVIALHHLGVSRYDPEFSDRNRAVSSVEILKFLTQNGVNLRR